MEEGFLPFRGDLGDKDYRIDSTLKRVRETLGKEYHSVPQEVHWGNSVGFNVGGEERARVSFDSEGVYFNFYSGRGLPAFAESC